MVNDEQNALSRAFAALCPFASSNRIPFEEKPWVKEAKIWTTGPKPPGSITLYVRFGSKEASYYCPPGTRFDSVKAIFAYENRKLFTWPGMSPSSLTMYYDGQRLPDEGTVKEYEMEDEDIIDIYYDRRQMDLSG